MGRFLNHTSCPKCGSSDARALYDDNSSYCFSCRSATGRSFGVCQHGGGEQKLGKVLPSDCTTVLSGAGWNWVRKYGLTAEQLIKNNVLYSPSRNQVIFTFPPTELWQARNFDREPKYLTSGPHDAILPIYSQSEADAIVLAEDCLSAIKISYVGCDSMPLLGSSLSSSKLSRIAKTYRNLVVWLDHDKGSEAHKIARRASLLGMQARVVHTELDPKDYRYGQIREYLND
jgi:hypothetical protein